MILKNISKYNLYNQVLTLNNKNLNIMIIMIWKNALMSILIINKINNLMAYNKHYLGLIRRIILFINY